MVLEELDFFVALEIQKLIDFAELRAWKLFLHNEVGIPHHSLYAFVVAFFLSLLALDGIWRSFVLNVQLLWRGELLILYGPSGFLV